MFPFEGPYHMSLAMFYILQIQEIQTHSVDLVYFQSK